MSLQAEKFCAIDHWGTWTKNGATTFGITTRSIMTLIVKSAAKTLNVITPSVITLGVTFPHCNAKCRYAECNYAKCNNAKCRHTECCGAKKQRRRL
jgi:hypothetical protein